MFQIQNINKWKQSVFAKEEKWNVRRYLSYNFDSILAKLSRLKH